MAGKALAGAAGLAALSQLPGGRRSNAAEALPPTTPPTQPAHAAKPTEKLRIATCQFPVSASPAENAKYIRDFMHQAAEEDATCCTRQRPACRDMPEAISRPSRNTTGTRCARRRADLRALAKDLKMWLVLGSAHFLDENTKPTNCLYLIDPEGKIVDRYDKCFCTGGDQKHYSAGNRLVTRDIRGVKDRPGHLLRHLLAAALHRLPGKGRDGDDPFLLQRAGPKARTAWTRSMFARCRPAAPTIACGPWPTTRRSPIPIGDRSSPGRTPRSPSSCRSISPACWFTTSPTPCPRAGGITIYRPMKKRDDEIMSWGTPSNHPRQRDGQAEP